MLGTLGMLGCVEQARAGAFVARSAPVRRGCTRASALEWDLRIFSGVSPELNVCSVS